MDARARWTGPLRTFGGELLDALWPRRCRLCGGAADDGLACAEHALPRRPAGPRCGRCARALPPALPDGYACAPCRRASPGVRRCVALGDYRADGGLREWLLALKHGGRRELAEPLGASLGTRLSEAAAPVRDTALLVPVPLHPLRRFERGFDQARLVAAAVAARTGLPHAALLARVRATPPQGEPESPGRSANVRDAFVLRPRRAARWREREIWLVDDVATSGATAAECARTLRRAGFREVALLVLARAG